MAIGLVLLLILSRDTPQPGDRPRPCAATTRTLCKPHTPPRLRRRLCKTPRSSGNRTIRPSSEQCARRESRTSRGPPMPPHSPRSSRPARRHLYVAGCIIERADEAQRAFAADTTWTGGKQWVGATLILLIDPTECGAGGTPSHRRRTRAAASPGRHRWNSSHRRPRRRLHIFEQSGLPSEPSSHCSPLSTMPSPQIGSLQSVRQAFGRSKFAEPLSHCSLAVRTPSPHTCSGSRRCTRRRAASRRTRGQDRSEVPAHLELVAREVRRQRHVVESPLLVDVLRGAVVTVVLGVVDPRARAVREDLRLIEVTVLDAEPAPVLQAHVAVAAGVDLRRTRPTPRPSARSCR